MSDLEAARIGPFFWWRWAVVSRLYPDIIGVGYWSKAAALAFWRSVAADFGESPYLLKRTGWRSFKIVR